MCIGSPLFTDADELAGYSAAARRGSTQSERG